MVTRTKKAELLKEEKSRLLNPYTSKDALKVGKKGLTKMVNLLYKTIQKRGSQFEDVAKEASMEFTYSELVSKEDTERSTLAKAVSFFHNPHPYINQLIFTEENLAIIKDTFPELYKEALSYWNDVKKDVSYVVTLTQHIQDEESRLKGTTAEQFALLASKSREITEDKQLAFARYATSLKDWKPTEIKNGKILVNGNPYKEGDLVGVMIGSGCRVHSMALSIAKREDKETGKAYEYIRISNHTQWRRSNLVILDLIDNIPLELRSERH